MKTLLPIELKALKNIDFKAIREFAKDQNRRAIIASNSSIIKEQPNRHVQSLSNSSGTTCFFSEPKIYDYEQLVIDMHELSKIQERLKK